MKTARAPGPQFTGRHMIGVMFAFFGVIIAVNVTMAVFARTSWTGLVVQNSYVASQEFNEKAHEAKAQAALGWRDDIEIAGGHVRIALSDPDGQPIRATGGVANFRRPAYAAEDESIRLEPLPQGGLGASHTLRDGIWIGEFLIDAGLEHPYRQVRRFTLRDGAMQ